MGACALILLVLPATAQSQSRSGLGAQLTKHLSTMKKDRQVLRFLRTHSWLLNDPRFATEAKRQLQVHTLSLERSDRKAAETRLAIARRAEARRLAVLAAQSPPQVICRVFGTYCGQALAVSRCESGLLTNAQNGQYLGLFQMGSSERRIFGHGSTAVAQTRAAHKYFVASGRDWSPWSCKPWH
ncbi:hypothetical protein [Gaiella sp.]|uniref:hypothetical protein n=1 Tax=Gaiella sp. TaxID=2663207 RepID=UPI0039830D31